MPPSQQRVQRAVFASMIPGLARPDAPKPPVEGAWRLFAAGSVLFVATALAVSGLV